MRSKPAVAGDWLLVGSQFGDVFALNKKTGKIGWHFSAGAAIRGAIVIIKKEEPAHRLFCRLQYQRVCRRCEDGEGDLEIKSGL
ncbi:MAG: hypothetical protein WDM78_03105 [Puia sp.]